MAESAATNAAPPAKPVATAPAAVGARGRLMNRDQLRLGLGLTAVVLLGGVIAWWFTRPATRSPAEQVTQALKLLDSGRYSAAREIAKRLEERGYRHPGFAGVLEFIQGMATFGIVESAPELSERTQYAVIITYLQKAEQLALSQERRPEWCYALGKSLYLVQDGAAARPLLEEVIGLEDRTEPYPPGRVDAAEMLVDLYLDPGVRTPDLLRQALALNDGVLAIESLKDRQRDIASLQRAEIFLTMKRFDEANAALESLSKETAKSHLSRILQARILLADEQPDEALRLLEPIALNNRIDQTHAAEACFLMGLVQERRSELSQSEAKSTDAAESAGREFRGEAIKYFKLTADRYARTPEATAANLHLGRLWRIAKSHENSLRAYGAALRSVQQPENFRNRWVSREQFRQAILDAWNGWLDEKQYQEAIALATLMTPLFPREEAYEYAARVHQRWAEALEDDLQGKRFSERQANLEQLRKQWTNCAAAYEELAKVRISSSKYPEALWSAADFYRRGHDFEQALKIINEFLATEPDRLMAAALVQRSRIEFDLDRIDEALADLRLVVLNYPTDPATFTAQYLIGVCHFEQNRLDEAAAVWESILMSDQLSPSAVEWRDSQLSLGQLLYQKGDLKRREILRRSSPPSPTQLAQVYEAASRNWQEAARHLGRYLDRNPSGRGAHEARYSLAKAQQREAEWLGRQLETADTDNARQQLQAQRDAMLQRSLKQFETLKDELQIGQSNDQIDELQQRLLKNSYFEIPHTLYELRDYDKAISAYNQAINKYPQDVHTLVAYIQMSQCHQHQRRATDARNMLQQAILLLSHKQIPKENFELPSTNFSPAEWQAWLERARMAD